MTNNNLKGFSVQHTLMDDISVSYEGKPLFSYKYVPEEVQLESPRPFLHPVNTLSGEEISLYRPHDHVWHKGISWSLPCVGKHNFWGGPTYVRGEGYVQLANNGRAIHQRFNNLDVNTNGVSIDHVLHWISEDESHLITERRRITAQVIESVQSAWALTFSSSMTNVSEEELSLGSPTTKGRDNAGYGGLFWRGPRSFTDGTIIAPDFAGGEEFRGNRSAWAGYTGQFDGSANFGSIIMVSAKDNPGGCPQWFARNEWFAGLCPAPFFSEEIPFTPEDTLTFKYAVIILDGEVSPSEAAELSEVGASLLG